MRLRRLIFLVVFVTGVVIGAEAAPTDVVTKADLQVLIERIAKLEAENKAQAERIAELEATNKASVEPTVVIEEKSATNETGRIITTEQGFKYYLADKSAKIFEPLSKNGLKLTPYGHLYFEGVHNTHGVETDMYGDWVHSPYGTKYNSHTTVFGAQDSILGVQLDTPETYNGWTFTGKLEFDLAGNHANDYALHWRHLYLKAMHESGWSIIMGQTWHLWKMVGPSLLDASWMENVGHPYRRSPQFSVIKTIDWENSQLEFRAGVLKNGPGMAGDRDLDGVQDDAASAWPLIEAAVIYEHDAPWQDEKDIGDKRWLIGFGGMYGQDRSHRLLPGGEFGEKEDYENIMGMVSAKIPMWNFTLTGQFYAGQNLGNIQAGVGQRVGFDEFGYGHEVSTKGGFIDLSYWLNKDWEWAVGYGIDDPDDEDARRSEGRLLNDRAYIVTYYRLTENLRLGLEYSRLSTKWYNKETGRSRFGYSDRIGFTALYDF